MTPVEVLDPKNFMIRVCCGCSKVCSDDGQWFDAPELLAVAPGNIRTHTLCPECCSRMYPAFAAKKGLISAS